LGEGGAAAAGIHVKLRHRFAAVPGARVLLWPAAYALVRGDEENAAHVLNVLQPAYLGAGAEHAEARAARDA